MSKGKKSAVLPSTEVTALSADVQNSAASVATKPITVVATMAASV